MKGTRAPGDELAMASFVDFLKTGDIGPLSVRRTLNEVYDLLGKPKESYHFYEGTEAYLLNLFYKNLVITFYKNELAIYIVQLMDSFKFTRGGLPPQLQANWVPMARKMTFEDFINLVKANELHCQRLVTEAPDDHMEELICFPESQIEVYFNLNIQNRIYQITCSNVWTENRPLEEIRW